MLAAPIAHEVYHQSPPGLNVQEALMGTTTQGQSPWIEGSEESATLDEQGGDAVEEGFRILDGLSERTHLLLMATPEERARGVVPRPRCRICPRARFGTWDTFTRHCEQSEAHPVSVKHCKFCVDFFGRGEACQRHEKKPPANCTIVSPAEADSLTIHRNNHAPFPHDQRRFLLRHVALIKRSLGLKSRAIISKLPFHSMGLRLIPSL